MSFGGITFITKEPLPVNFHGSELDGAVGLTLPRNHLLVMIQFLVD